MPSDFQWQTEDDGWEETPAPQEEKAPSGKRPYTRILIGLLIVAGIGLLIFRQVQQQLEAAVQRAEDEVGRTHGLVLQAADRADHDLMLSLISGIDNAWLNQTLTLTEAGRLFNPVDFGLTPRADSQPQLAFDLNPDFTAAEVTMTRDYTVLSPDGRPETVALNQTALYRRAEDRWLYAPPENADEFWDRTATLEGDYLDITYPRRDSGQAEALASYLEAKIDELCSDLPDFSCSPDLHLSLVLDHELTRQLGLTETLSTIELERICPDVDEDCRLEPEVMNTVSGDVVVFEVRQPNAVIQVTLPTFSLIGTPVDEKAAEALYRGYAVYVLQAAMIASLDFDCCARALMIHALIDYQLAELDLRPYPLHPGDYERLFGRFQQLNELDTAWSSREFDLTEESDWGWAYALTEFLLTTSQANTTAGGMLLSLPEAIDYTDWMNTFLLTSIDDVTVRQAWLNFIYGSSLSGQVAVNQTPPDQNIILRCENISQPRTVFYSYDWDRADWVVAEEIEEQTFIMDPLVDDSAVVIQEVAGDGPAALSLWNDGQLTLLRPGADEGQPAYYYNGESSPDGRKLVLISIDRSGGYHLLNLDDCDELGCTADVVDGQPTWSPDSSQMLIQVLEMVDQSAFIRGLQRIDASGQLIQLSENGFSPFWFNNEEYGFMQTGQESGLYGASVVDDLPRLLLTSEELLAALPSDSGPPDLIIGFATPNPTVDHLLAIAAYSSGQNASEAHFFLWNRQTRELDHLQRMQTVNFGLPQWLPNGEWLIVPTFQDSALSSFLNSSWSYFLFNSDPDVPNLVINGRQSRGFTGLDYSMDSQWLTAVNEGFVELVNLEFEVGDHQPYRQLLPYSFPNCQEAIFIW